jgi:hypothetical protein
MPRKIGPSRTVQFSITLPEQAVEMMRRLEGTGFFSSSRGEVARELILAHLRYLGGPVIADALKQRTGKKKKK